VNVAYEWIVDGLADIWDRIDRTVRPINPDAYDAPTPCPGWSVRDVLSHLLGFELLLQGAPPPDAIDTYPSYVRNAIGELNERFVAAYRDRPGIEVLNDFRHVTFSSLARLRALSDEEWEVVGWTPEGDAPHHRFQETRILDSWIHLQDIRDALAMPEDDHGVGEEVVVNRFEGALPYVIGKRAAASDGTTVRVNLSGRLARSVTIGVQAGRATVVNASSDELDLELTTPVALFWRRAAGRISADAFLGASATSVRGDEDLARRIADSLAVLI